MTFRRRPRSSSVGATTGARPEPAAGLGYGRFSALSVPAFRTYFIATVISNTGSWMQIVGQGWLVLELTDSPFYLGLVGLVRAVPTILLSMIGGVLADRFDRQRILLITQSVVMAASIALAALTLAGIITVWQILLVTFISAIFFAVDNPTRQALVPDLVGRERVTSAIGLNAAAWNAAAVIGPSIAGVSIALISIGGAFLINAASFIPVLIAIFLMPPLERRASSGRSMLRQLVDGMSYIRANRVVWGILLLIAIPSICARPYVQMMPVFARDVLGLGASGYGVLMAASGVGALFGALTLASINTARGRGTLLLVVTASLGASLVAFSWSHWLVPSLALVVAVGGTSTLMMSLANSLLQGTVAAEVRGRVMSVYTLIAGGLMPLGSMLLGGVGTVIGVPLAVGIGGAITLATAAACYRAIAELRDLG
ncbi:MAG TPA: MFS transporter [Thermomicrobiales bacterium]|nr:MFS transporter [Thermomicrobiales bacterium]